jgi:hypothetical protein
VVILRVSILVREASGLCPLRCFYEKVIKVKADVAALLMSDLMFDLRHISTEKFALGSLRSDDWQLGRPTASPFCLSSRETLLVFFRAA